MNIKMFLNKHNISLWLLGFAWFATVFSACIEIEEYDNSPRGNFEALWKIMDEQYCFFDYKNVDWDSIHTVYSGKIDNQMNQVALFDSLDAMLQEVKDGHVNLYSPFDVGRYWKWFEDYPANYNQELTDKYLGQTYRIAGGMRYQMLEDSIGYVRYADFSLPIGETGIQYVLASFQKCKGIIIDVRNNGGGLLSNSELLASHFFTKKTLVGYIQHKTGKGHNDFSEPYPQYIEPATYWICKQPVVVLTNRKCYSATNDFVNAMKRATNVTILGDQTGGGSGLPFSSELPNGWSVRFSACPMYNADNEQIEFGIEPDVWYSLSPEDVAGGKDTLIEAARALIQEKDV
ncbi:MAG: S41 family peptidase [Candidatus Symbiothrix sp.]|jgi:hypothetical protein|nr:S41 family peptidase [Candidatus Symbiothrix sp.]